MTYNIEKKTEEICKFLEDGCTEKMSARLSGIDPVTFFRWKADNVTFATKVEAAIDRYKQKLIININRNTDKDGKLGLDVLRSRWPDEFINKQTIVLEKAEDKVKKALDLLKDGTNLLPEDSSNLLQDEGGTTLSTDEGSE